jgi:hypothetical protein
VAEKICITLKNIVTFCDTRLNVRVQNPVPSTFDLYEHAIVVASCDLPAFKNTCAVIGTARIDHVLVFGRPKPVLNVIIEQYVLPNDAHEAFCRRIDSKDIVPPDAGE